MQFLTVCRAVFLAVLVGLLAGCGGREEHSVAEKPRVSGMDGLPPLGGSIGPLDQNRIEVAPPEGWHVPLRDNRWIVRFTPSEAVSYPSILITGEDYGQIVNVSKQNVDEFARQIDASFESDGSLERPSTSVVRVETGQFVGVGYRRRAKARHRFKTIILERLILETVIDGRKYSIELRTREGDLDRYRQYALAVAGGINFIGGSRSRDNVRGGALGQGGRG